MWRGEAWYTRYCSSDKTMLSLEIDGGHRRRNRKGDKRSKTFLRNTWGTSVTSAHVLGASLLGLGTVVRLERDTRLMVK